MSGLRKYLLMFLALAASLVTGTSLAAGHTACQDCHDAGTPSANNLLQPLSGLCINCHQARVSRGEHAVDIPVPTAPPGLPLQAGVMTCITCHDPHGKGLALRKNDPPLCKTCHRR